jgi:hypothetical protein
MKESCFMLNYNIPNTFQKEETRVNFSQSYFSEEEIIALKEKWRIEEKRLKNADICGFDEENRVAEIVHRGDSGLTPEQETELKEYAKKYHSQQRKKIEKEFEKQSKKEIQVEVYADMLKVKQPLSGNIKGGGEREECKGFSESSRRRLIQKMAQWNLNGLYTSFVTLTYPAIYADDWKKWKNDLDNFFKRIERKYGFLVGLCWRIEFQKRGAPHFHLIVASTESLCSCGSEEKRVIKGKEKRVHKPHCEIHKFRKEIGEGWAEIVKTGYRSSGGDMGLYEADFAKHRVAGTNIEVLGKDRKQLMAYVSKYMGKVDQDNVPDEFGRNWGFRNINGELDFSPVKILLLNYRENVGLKRIIRKWLKSRGKCKYAVRISGMASFSVLGMGAENLTADKLLSGVTEGLFAPHISPASGGGGSGAGSGEMRFVDRVSAGIVKVKREAVKIGVRVYTPAGAGTVSNIVQCPILKRWRCVVALDAVQNNGSRFGAFDLWMVRSVDLRQSALF